MTEEDVSKLTYEEAITKLEKVVATLESGSAELDKSIELYTLGAKLKEHCQEKLNKAEEKISTLMQKSDGNGMELKPFSTSS
jgi:exodeoxyribonuclease VII small subunit